MIDHTILDYCGILGVSNSFLSSYLSNRLQFVSLCTTKSHMRKSYIQGSVLEPILVNLNMNDSVNVSDKFKYVLFADDNKV